MKIDQDDMKQTLRITFNDAKVEREEEPWPNLRVLLDGEGRIAAIELSDLGETLAEGNDVWPNKKPEP